MPAVPAAVVFEKGLVTCTFLVDLEAFDRDALKRDLLQAHHDDLASDPLTEEVLAVLDDPKFLAESIVRQRFRAIIKKTKPHAVTVDLFFLYGKKAEAVMEAARLTSVREQVERGERTGYLVTVCLEFERPDLSRPYDTRPHPLPFPGFSWLTSQIGDEPTTGLSLLHFSATQIPS